MLYECFYIEVDCQEAPLVRVGNKVDFLRFGNVKFKAQLLRAPDQEAIKSKITVNLSLARDIFTIVGMWLTV